MRGDTKWVTAMAAALWTLVLIACSRPQPTNATTAAEPFVPGLGEIMSLQQMRHVKLWFAGQAGNWKLASYEVDELSEGFDDVVRLHPTHKESPVAPRDAVPRMTTAPLDQLRTAIKKEDTAAFAAAYDAMTAACDGCHVATNFEFNRVQRPSGNPFPNQNFGPLDR
jgi:hypothetical protein